MSFPSASRSRRAAAPSGAPPGLPFTWDALTVSRGLNFTLTTTAGDIDVLGEIARSGEALLEERGRQ